MRLNGALFAILSVTSTQAWMLERRQDGSTPTSTAGIVSVFQVLQTALPPSLVGLALTNSPSASMIIASQFREGSTPAWFTGLPTDVQQFLIPLATSFPGGQFSSILSQATNTASSTTEETSSATSESSSSSSSEESETSSSTESAASATEASSSSSSAGASMPTAVVGAGIAGAIGVLGLILA